MIARLFYIMRIKFTLQKKIAGHKLFLLLGVLLSLFLRPQNVEALTVTEESYTLSVGQSVTISQNTYGGGYISKAVAYNNDPHLSTSVDVANQITITVNSYFDYTAKISLVFVETYENYWSGRWHKNVLTTQKNISITCKYQKPDPTKKPTKVLLPERIRVNLDEKITVTAYLEPNGAQATTSYWDGYGQIFRVFGVENEPLKCTVSGRAIGLAKLSIKVDDDDNLKASSMVEVVDPNNLPPTKFILPDTIEVSVGGQCVIKPILIPEGTTTSFAYRTENQTVAKVESGTLIGQKVGITRLTAKSYYELTDTCIVKVVEKDGRDDNVEEEQVMFGVIRGHEYVDLGIGLKWATKDLSGSYAWGETSTKSEYSKDTYKYYNAPSSSSIYNSGYTYLGDDIKETQYDAAYVNWGQEWRMPTRDEANELIARCSFEKSSQEGYAGYLVSGPNGRSIFLSDGLRWTSSIGSSLTAGVSQMAYYFYTNSYKDTHTTSTQTRYLGMRIRPVTTIDASDTNHQPTKVLIPSVINLKKGETTVLQYELTPSDATTTLRFASDNPSVARVSFKGEVTAMMAGETTISVETGNGIKAYCNVIVKDISGIVQAMANNNGGSTSFFLDREGTLWGCGFNQLGILTGPPINYRKPIVKVMEDVATVAIGGTLSPTSLVVKKDGSLWTCGQNLRNQLGDNRKDQNCYVYKKVMDDVASVAVGGYYSYALKNDATLWRFYFSNTKVLEDVKSISAGVDNIYAIKKDGSLWVSGSNKYGQLGDGTTEDKSSFVQVAENVSLVSAGYGHALIIKNDGTLWSVGCNNDGELGDGTTENRSVFTKIMDDVVFASVGYRFSLAIKKDETLWAWGVNDCGQLGDGTLENRINPIKILNAVSAVAAGAFHSLIVKKDGSLWGCGRNSYNQINTDTTTNYLTPEIMIKGYGREVKLSSNGYATFYDSANAYTLPTELSAQVVSRASDNKLTYTNIADGATSGVIPKGTAVMLQNKAKSTGEYFLLPTESPTTYSGANLLQGSDDSTMTSGDGYHYKLSYGEPGTNLNNVFGWYWGAQNGGAFQIEGHKAWLVIPKSLATRSYALDEGVTNIGSLTSDEGQAEIYDLQGRRVSTPSKKGMYIRNGKKVVIK